MKELDTELDMMRGEFRRLVREQSQRMAELAEEKQSESSDPNERAEEAINAILYAARAETKLLGQQIADLDRMIGTERDAAIDLARYEQENHSMLREIERTRQLMDQLQEQMARVSLTEEDGSTRVDELTAPSAAYKVGPNLARSLGICGFLGLAIGSGLALLLEKNANTFRDPEEISSLLGVPVLTHVPFFKGRRAKARKGEDDPAGELDPSLAVVHQPASIAAEAIRSCRTSIFFELSGTGGKVMQVTSPLPGDGKSTIAGNLACSIAQSGKKVLAIDCDLRRPQLTDNFAFADQLGLTNVLNGDCEPHEACHQSPISSLHVMPSGPIPANPAEALTLPDMHDLIALLRERYDFIIIDTPPLLVVTDPSITAGMVDGVVLALRVRRKSRPNARESINILQAVGARVLGVVINNSDEASSSDGYRGYGYYRYGRYTSRYYYRNAYSANGYYRRGEGSAKRERLHVSGREAGIARKAAAIQTGESSASEVME